MKMRRVRYRRLLAARKSGRKFRRAQDRFNRSALPFRDRSPDCLFGSFNADQVRARCSQLGKLRRRFLSQLIWIDRSLSEKRRLPSGGRRER